ncbi:hypothetical protein BDF19DRAFT_94976 [Syncephalis fuscata]|nr:hypothetical protein BDF19DRAFT_94976 [Syncephalis fuscata]
MISWYMMLQAIVRFVFFFAILRQAWSVDKYVQDNALASLTKTTPVIEQTTAANVSGVTTTTTTPELEKPAVVVEDTVAVTAISEDSLRTIAQIPGLNNLSVPNGAYLKPFLVPRVVGTESHRKVQDYIRKTFTDLGWKIDEDRFNASTPLGIKSFNNIVATKFPDATRQLVLSAHYDSKYFAPPDENKFIGATDSSVPCAMLVDIATSLNSRLDRLRDTDRGLQIIFFDGEEAFKTWTHTDSIYGSR